MYFEPMDAEMILWARVAELRDEVGHEDFEEVMELFVEEVAETLERIRQPGCDMEAELHFLKGSAMNLGFRGLALACLNGENSSTSTVDFDELSSIFESSKQALQSGPTNAA